MLPVLSFLSFLSFLSCLSFLVFFSFLSALSFFDFFSFLSDLDGEASALYEKIKIRFRRHHLYPFLAASVSSTVNARENNKRSELIVVKFSQAKLWCKRDYDDATDERTKPLVFPSVFTYEETTCSCCKTHKQKSHKSSPMQDSTVAVGDVGSDVDGS